MKLKWLKEVFSEPDNGDKDGKVSFSRIFGATVLILIFVSGWRSKAIPPEWMTVFWVLIGYQFLSKALGPDGVKALINWKTGSSTPTPPTDIKPG